MCCCLLLMCDVLCFACCVMFVGFVFGLLAVGCGCCVVFVV